MIYKIKELMTVNRGSSPRPIIEYLSNSGFKWLKISDFNYRDKFVYNTKEYIKEIKNTKYVKAGTLILTNSATPGIPIFLGKDMCLHDGFLYFTNIENKVNINYIFYWFQNYRDSILNLANGSVFKNLKKEIVENLEMDLPSMDIQNKVVYILDTINNKINLNSEINNNLYKFTNKLFQKLFEENEIREYKRLDEISDCQNGHAFYKEGYDEDGLMVIDLGNVNLNSNFIYTNADKFIDKSRIPNEKFIVKKDDLVMIMTDRKATMDLLGKTAKIYENKEYALNQRIYRIRSKINVNYLYTYLNSDKVLQELKSKALGSVQKYINTNVINEIMIPLFEKKNMEEFSNVVNPIFKYMENNIIESKNLEQLRDTLLPKLMNGEIDLYNIEI